MNKKKMVMLASVMTVLVTICITAWSTIGLAKIDPVKLKFKLKKPDVFSAGIWVGYNNWAYIMKNEGRYFYDSADLDDDNNASGGAFPRGAGLTIVYAAGLYVATLKNGIPVCSESEFSSEWQPGRITNSGTNFYGLIGEDPAPASQKVYLVVNSTNRDADDPDRISDYTNWPGLRNAANDPAIIADAQTWVVFNDLDTTLNQENSLTESPLPGLGLEVVLESYAINQGKLADVVFLRMLITNKTNTNYSNSFIGLWMDPDVVDSGNDIVGVDTLAGLGFTYNASNEPNDAATGFDFFQGPVVPSVSVDPGLAAKFAANTTHLVYNPTLNAFEVQPLAAGEIWLGATSFNTYANGTDPADNEERYNLLKGLNKDGTGKFGVGLNYKYAYPGNPLTQQGTSHVASGAGTDQRILHGVGPFTILAGTTAEIWAGVIGGEGETRLGAFAVMKTTDVYAQTIFNAALNYPTAPLTPKISVVPLDGEVAITWDNAAEYSIDVFGVRSGLTDANGVHDTLTYSGAYRKNDFEGYRIYRSRTGLTGSYEKIAEFDLINSLLSVTNTFIDGNGYARMEEVVFGTDNGLRHSYTDHDVINGQTYFYSVVAYDAQPYIGLVGSPIVGSGGVSIAGPIGLDISLESPTSANVVRVIPMAAVSGSRYNANLMEIDHTQGISDGVFSMEVYDPTKVVPGTYTIEFFTIPSDSQGAPLVGTTPGLAYRFKLNNQIVTLENRVTDNPATFYDVNTNGTFEVGDIPLDESKFATSQTSTSDTVQRPVIFNGLSVTVFGPSLNYKDFLAVANGAGAIDPPSYAAFAFNSSHFPSALPGFDPANGVGDRPAADQQVGGGRWGFHTPTNTITSATVAAFPDYSNFLFRTTQFTGGLGEAATGIGVVIPDDIEIRFTATGSDAFLHFTSGNIINIPFEAWNNRGTTDPSDDYQLVVLVLDDDGSETFNVSGIDHGISGGDNDPQTDVFYLVAPQDKTPGNAAYTQILADIAADPAAAAAAALWLNKDDTYGTIPSLIRLVMVNFNGGSVSAVNFPANLNQQMPETGSIFRLVTTKPNQDEDEFQFTVNANTQSTAKKDIKEDLKNIRVVPNPYYGRSSYQASLFDKRIKFTNLPANCTIKIFTVSGDLVNILNHNDASNNDRANDNPLDLSFGGDASSTSTEVWNLQNTTGKFVASGMYIALIDAPGKGKKMVKFAVIQEAVTINGPDVR